MLVFDDQARAAGLAGGFTDGSSALGVYEPEQRAWLPHLTVVRFRERPRLAPFPELGPLVRPTLLFTFRAAAGGAQYEVTVESVPLGGG